MTFATITQTLKLRFFAKSPISKIICLKSMTKITGSGKREKHIFTSTLFLSFLINERSQQQFDIQYFTVSFLIVQKNKGRVSDCKRWEKIFFLIISTLLKDCPIEEQTLHYVLK